MEKRNFHKVGLTEFPEFKKITMTKLKERTDENVWVCLLKDRTDETFLKKAAIVNKGAQFP